MFGLSPYRRNQMSYNPYRDFEEFEKELFRDPFTGFFNAENLAEFKTDVSETADGYLLEADLPGFKKEDINVNIKDNTLTITAERHSEAEKEDRKQNYLHCERSYGKFTRSFDISNIDAENIKAKYQDGVLKLTMPKLPEIQPKARQLEIE